MLRAQRAGDIRQTNTNTLPGLRHALVAVACLLAICTGASAQVNAQPGAVVLVARIPDQVGVQWGSMQVTELLRQQQLLPEGNAGYTAHLFMFENSIHMAMGQVVVGESQLEANEGRAEMLSMDSTAASRIPVWSWLSTEPVRTSRWQGPDPRRGRQQVMQSCLVVAEEGETPLLRVRLAAL